MRHAPHARRDTWDSAKDLHEISVVNASGALHRRPAPRPARHILDALRRPPGVIRRRVSALLMDIGRCESALRVLTGSCWRTNMECVCVFAARVKNHLDPIDTVIPVVA